MFIFKKILAKFIFPVPVLAILFIIGLINICSKTKSKRGKVFISIGVIIFLLLSNSFVARALLLSLEQQYPFYKYSDNNTKDLSIKYVVVLGGGFVADSDLPDASQLCESSIVRIVEGIKIYRKIKGSKLILSGGRPLGVEPIADAMNEVALDLGVPSHDIILEKDSKDTKDQAVMVQNIVGEKRFILVTSASHIPRAMAMFKNLGMLPLAAPAGYLVKKDSSDNLKKFLPSIENLLISNVAIYEYYGILWARLMGQI